MKASNMIIVQKAINYAKFEIEQFVNGCLILHL